MGIDLLDLLVVIGGIAPSALDSFFLNAPWVNK